MSDHWFDELARALATPMPRRRALKTLGAALAVGLLPASRPSVAAGQASRTSACPPLYKRCFVAIKYGTHEGGCYNPDDRKCCKGPNNDPVHPNQMSWTCPKYYECGAPGPGPGICIHGCPPDQQKCGRSGCCLPNERCEDGICVTCPNICGKKCCEDSQDCANARLNLCCQKNWKKCTAGSAGVVKCCPPDDTCCLDFKTQTSTCCPKGRPCTNGACKCPKGLRPCGKNCCKPGEVCLNGKCCPRGKTDCGDGQCCTKGKCCGKTCCEGSAFCCKGTCCKKGEFCTATAGARGKKGCCPSSRVITPGGVPVCCPPGTVGVNEEFCCAPGNPNCCGGSGDELACLGKAVCVRGVCVNY